jgi:hypothetical protein
MSLRTFGSSITGAITGFARGGIPGAIGGIVGAIIGHQPPSPAQPFSNMPVPQGGGFGAPGTSIPTLPGFPTIGFAPKGPAACPRGYHLNKHPLAASKRHKAMPARSMCVRNRHMNPMNYRALTRSLRRVKRAGKIVARLHHFNAPHHRRLPARAVALSENLRITSGK